MSDWKKMVCDYKACSKIATQEWSATGLSNHGPTTVECVYCDHHSRTHAEGSRAHRMIGLVNGGSGQ